MALRGYVIPQDTVLVNRNRNRRVVGLCPEGESCWAYVKDDTQVSGSKPMRVLLWAIVEDELVNTEVIGLVFDESAGFIRPVDEIEGFTTYKKGML